MKSNGVKRRRESSATAPRDAARAKKISAAVVRWFRREQRALPWRESHDPYAIWICEVMAQQTRLATVRPYHERFVARFPDVYALAAAEPDDVLAHWSGLGYYARARNLHAAAKLIVARHDGKIPDTTAQLAALPGIGPYTAGAIASIAFGRREPALDGNVTRVLTRLFDVTGDPARPATRREIEALARSLVPRNPRPFNEGLMELGALVCTPRNPRCAACPLRAPCQAFARGTAAERPAKKRKPKVATVEIYLAAIKRRDGALLLVKQPDDGLFGGLYCLPIAPHPLSPSPLDAARGDELRKAVPVSPSPGQLERGEGGEVDGEAVFSHTLTHRKLIVHVVAGRAPKKIAARHRWVKTAADLEGIGIATITRRALEAAVGIRLASLRRSAGRTRPR